MTSEVVAAHGHGSPYDEDDIELGLRALALCAGNYTKAGDLLKEEGLRVPDRTTLGRWKKAHPERYRAIQEDVLPDLDLARAERSEALADKLTDIEEQLADQVADTLHELTGEKAANSLYKTALAKAINQDKARAFRGQPSSIVAHVDVNEMVKSMQARFGNVIEVEGEDVTDK